MTYSLILGGLVLGSSWLLVRWLKELLRGKDVPGLALAFFPVLSTWLTLGVGGLYAMATPLPERSVDLGVGYSDRSVLVISLLALAACGLYSRSFLVASGRYNLSTGSESLLARIRARRLAILPLAGMFFVLDLYIRYRMLRAGTYFYWFQEADATLVLSTSAVQQAQPTVGAAALALGVLAVRTSSGALGKWIAAGFIAGTVLLLAFATGSRQVMLMSMALVVFCLLATSKVQLREQEAMLRKWVTLIVIALAVFLGLLSPIVQEARYAMLFDRAADRYGYVRLPASFLFHYVPQVLDYEVLFGDEGFRRLDRGAGGGERLSTTAAFFASIHEQFVRGREPLGPDASLRAMGVLVPRFLNPNKRALRAEEEVFIGIGVGRRGFDAGSTVLANAYAYGGIAGLMIFALLGGLSYGWLSRLFVNRLGLLGLPFLLASMHIADFESDSFAVWFSGPRNLVVILLFLLVVVALIRSFEPRRTPAMPMLRLAH